MEALLRRRRLGMMQGGYKIFGRVELVPKGHVSPLRALVLGVRIINELLCFYDAIRPYVRVLEMFLERLHCNPLFASFD